MPGKTSYRLLCVDDDQDSAEMVSLLLQSYGVEVTCAQSVSEAWLKIRAERFDLLMLDVWMPRVSGFEFSRQLRDSGCTMPILFYSGAAGEPYKQNAFAAGGNAYVTKPDIQGLVETVLTLIVAAETGSLPTGHFDHKPHPANNSLSKRSFRVVRAAIDEGPMAD